VKFFWEIWSKTLDDPTAFFLRTNIAKPAFMRAGFSRAKSQQTCGSCNRRSSSCATQRSVERLWLSTFDWTRASMLNIARMAWFSSDRTIGEYAQDIWKVPFELPSNREQEQTP
jgi:hypothetical protein